MLMGLFFHLMLEGTVTGRLEKCITDSFVILGTCCDRFSGKISLLKFSVLSDINQHCINIRFNYLFSYLFQYLFNYLFQI